MITFICPLCYYYVKNRALIHAFKTFGSRLIPTTTSLSSLPSFPSLSDEQQQNNWLEQFLKINNSSGGEWHFNEKNSTETNPLLQDLFTPPFTDDTASKADPAPSHNSDTDKKAATDESDETEETTQTTKTNNARAKSMPGIVIDHETIQGIASNMLTKLQTSGDFNQLLRGAAKFRRGGKAKTG